jgi:hypothetical protein
VEQEWSAPARLHALRVVQDYSLMSVRRIVKCVDQDLWQRVVAGAQGPSAQGQQPAQHAPLESSLPHPRRLVRCVRRGLWQRSTLVLVQ